ncbi:N-6 DNA methylase [Alicyclobacillus cycloheptanicus]|uniref:site-specific DNA-methyltransferase (adenine-specific) n=1 Tax=Alicyclobacillus cycloheptanicus TaxID=1457 RepID=A0ABT9XK13_9BACL|nr:N-6 DNA methylase [Alicyclobacillus cycloheptanicus]MDQ0190620.1 16S rRNA G966 N2-methylase RsmD [Alicyclobacillus cycloheptanicus]WDM01821.1 N-6 DNA methylase [Alicyclobacillus cycloheptanicus]
MASTLVEKRVTKQKATGSHFTPPELAEVVARRLISELDNGQFQNGNITVLDPSCGDGELLLAFERESTDKRFSLLGVEEDDESIQSAKHRLADFERQTNLVRGDFLDMVRLETGLSLFEETSDVLAEKADVIIANPPYVRTQILGAEKAQQLAKKFGLSGRVDLYHAFLVAMTLQLKPGGLLGVITSNRYLTTRGGAAIREFLSTHYDIIEILDLGDTKLFGAAVLPAIFVGRKKQHVGSNSEESRARFLRIYEDNVSEKGSEYPTVDSVYDLLDGDKTGTFFSEKESKHYTVSIGYLTTPENHKEPWVMATTQENSWLEKVDSGCAYRIEDVADVRVGIKTTADSVFIRSDWDDLPDELQPEAEVLRPLFSAEYAERWKPTESKPSRRVLYTHQIKNGKRRPIDLAEYVKAANYLESHRERLEGRTYVRKAGRMWYEVWVPQNPALWELPKVVFPDISPEPKFFFDAEGCVVDGNCYWIVPKQGIDNDMLFLVMAIANTRFMTKYHDIAFQNKLYAGRRRYLTQYISKYPVPDPTSEHAMQLVALAKRLVFEEVSVQERQAIEEQIEHFTALSFGLDPSDV